MESAKPSMPLTEIQKYKTLPPIKNSNAPNPPASRSQRRQTEARKLWAKPEPPLPFLMHLGVTARSHSVDDFLDNFSGEMLQHFLYRQTKTAAARNNASDATPLSNSKNKRRTALASTWQELVNCAKQEAQLVTDVLSTVIKGLLEETQFHEAVMRSIAEPTPYFCQFWSEESARLHDKKQSSGTSPTTPSPEVSAKDKTGEEDTWRGEVSPSGTSDAVESLSVIIRKEQFREEREAILRMPAYANLAELVLDNTIQNVLVEASRGEVVLTARPRIIALPPLLFQNSSMKDQDTSARTKDFCGSSSSRRKVRTEYEEYREFSSAESCDRLSQAFVVPLSCLSSEMKDSDRQRHITLPS